MKRTLVITVPAMLLIASVGAVAAAATPTGKSTVRQFEVNVANPSPDSIPGSGKLTVDTKEQWCVFNGKGLTPTQMYYLSINRQPLALARPPLTVYSTWRASVS